VGYLNLAVRFGPKVPFKTMTQKSKIYLLLPFYNPSIDWEKNILNNFKKIEQSHSAYEWQLCIVNDGSTNEIQAALEYLKNHIPGLTIVDYKQNQGKGHALRSGLKQLEADLYILTDVDFPYQSTAISTVLNEFKNDDPAVYLGQRSEAYYKAIPGVRKLISQMLKLMNRLVMRLVTNDTQCGFKAINNQGKAIFLKTKTKGFLYDLEFVKLVSRDKNVKVQLIPVTLKRDIELSSIHPLSLVNEFKDFLRIVFFA